MIGKVFDRIAAVQDKSTKTEKKLIQGLNELERERLIYFSITELAAELDIAEATIVRFCRKLGYNGFQDFKLCLSRELDKSDPVSDSPTHRIAAKMTEAIDHTFKGLDYKTCLEIADIIVNANKISAFGVGSSYIPVVEINNVFARVGINVTATADAHLQTMILGNMNEKDAVILISVSGSTKDVIDAAAIAKKNGVKIIVITCYERSPLAKYADYILLSTLHEAAYEGGSLSTIASITYIVDVLLSAVHAKIGPSASQRMLQASDSVTDKSI